MRMTSLLKLVIAALVLATFVPAVSAQGTGGGIDAKIAFVNSLDVLQGCAEGKAEIAKVDVFASNKEKEIQTASQELNTLRTNYQSEAATLNPATAAEMQAAISAKERQVRRLTEDAESALEAKRAELFSKMGDKIRTIISEYAEQNGIDVVFLESPALPFHAAALNITQDIIRACDAKYQVN